MGGPYDPLTSFDKSKVLHQCTVCSGKFWKVCNGDFDAGKPGLRICMENCSTEIVMCSSCDSMVSNCGIAMVEKRFKERCRL
mmetsp:Transcript_5808/g.9034  ORF Transcript_5808/g.9034 Transcript_5808/m.9034 type:complete len:82 (+) Transcript_5808:518-763(+)